MKRLSNVTKPLMFALPLALSVAGTQASAAELDIEITNLTNGIFFTPLLITAHDSTVDYFTVGTAASDELQAMAEGGNISLLMGTTTTENALHIDDSEAALLAPSTSSTASMNVGDMSHLSIVSMLLPTNDGFVGLDSWEIPQEAGTYTVYLNGYDAGTEANTELVSEGSGAPNVLGIPANPGGNGGTGGTGVATEDANPTVHIHRGNIGDISSTGGASDLDSRIHRWLNPVAKVVITVSGVAVDEAADAAEQ